MDINPDIVGEYKYDVDTVTLLQSTVNISAPRVLVEQVDHIKATIDVNTKENNKLTQRVKLVPVNAKGDEVSGVNLEVKNISAEVTFLEEKKVPINIQLENLEKITYINTSKIDSKTIGSSKTVDLVIPKDVTSDEKSVVIKSKDQESSVQRLIYKKDEVELVNNSKNVNINDLNIPDNINVEVQLDNNTSLSKSDISLYIDLDANNDEVKEYTIKYKSNITFKNIKIIPSVINK